MAAPLSTESVRARLGALLPGLRAEYGVRSLAIFGAYARGEQTAESDLDLLVEFEEVPGMFRFASLQLELEGQLGVQGDLFTRPVPDSERAVPTRWISDASRLGDVANAGLLETLRF